MNVYDIYDVPAAPAQGRRPATPGEIVECYYVGRAIGTDEADAVQRQMLRSLDEPAEGRVWLTHFIRPLDAEEVSIANHYAQQGEI